MNALRETLKHSTARSATLACAALLGLAAAPAGAQALTHRYSFNGSAADSVGGADGSVVGNVTLTTMPTVNGAAVFAGGTSATSPGFISLPSSVVSGLTNATVEIFTTNFTIPKDQTGTPGGQFQALLSVATLLNTLTNYMILAPNRAGTGLGLGERTNNAGEQTVVAHDPLPAGYGNHVVTLVYSGFTGAGSTGTQTLYVDGAQVAQAQTVYSFATLATGTGGIPVVGLGGGSPFNDPTFQGSMSEVRIYNDALTPAQVLAEVNTGPAQFGYQPGLSLTTPTASSLLTDHATVSWNSNNAATATVNYGPTSAYGATASVPKNAFSHAVTLANLTPFAVYHYQVTSTDVYGQKVSSADQTFTTASSSGARLGVNKVTVVKVGSQDVATITFTNTGAADATGVQITSAQLGTAVAFRLPVPVGTVPSMGTATGTVSFPAQPSGHTLLLKLSAPFSAGTAVATVKVVAP